MMHKGNSKFDGNSKNKVLIETAECMGSLLEGKKIKELEWPSSCLLVSIKRGEQEIIPKGNTKIYAGDYLITLANEDKASEIREKLTEAAEILNKEVNE
jgi:Trk K+ transport system NAD-binding subunit